MGESDRGLNYMSSFSEANALFRAGCYPEALERFAELYRNNPDFAPYRSGLLNTLKRLKMDDREIDAYMSLNNRNADTASHAEAVHPESLAKIEGREKTFVVVTPVLNGEKFLDQTIESVVTQKGNFFIDYFIKDGGSNDSTAAILGNWCKRIRLGELPLNCNGIRLRFESSRDNGLYDAVAHGFSKVSASRHDILTYINADDYFINDAFEIADRVFSRIPETRWICGQISVVDEQNNVLVSPKFPLTYAREDIHQGLHDGRALYFIQQEGVFWSRELYELVGGINRTLKLAGDFDLWKRFAAHSELLALSCNLAFFRSRPGQLSAQLDKYYIEVDHLNNQRDSSHSSSSLSKSFDSDGKHFWVGNKSPQRGKLQAPGPICFLTEDRCIREVAYVKRAWFDW